MVTAQALQAVRLRSVKKHGGLQPDALQENVPTPHSANTICREPIETRVIVNEASALVDDAGHSENPWQTDSSYWTLSGTKPKPRRGHRATEKKGDDGKSLEHHIFKGYSDSKHWIMVSKSGSPRNIPSLEKPGSPKNVPSPEKPGSPRKVLSLEKPSLPKKPDLGVLGLMSTTIFKEGPEVQRSSGQMAKGSSDLCHFQPDETGIPDGSTSPQNLNSEALPVNVSTAADVTPTLYASFPKKLKPPILHKKPKVSMTPLKKSRPIFCANKGYLTTGTPMNCTSMCTPQAEKIFDMLVGTMENCESDCPLELQGTGRHCGPSVIMGIHELQTITEVQSCAVKQTPTETSCILGDLESGSLPSLVGLQPHVGDGTANQRRLIKSPLTEVQEEEEETYGGMRTQMLMASSAGKKKDRKRRKRSCRHLLMLSPPKEPTTSSSSSSSTSSSSSQSSSEDEREEVKTRLAKMGAAISQAHYKDTSDSEGSDVPLSHSKYSLSSALSSDSLQMELSLPDLLIREGDEDGSQDVEHEGNNEARRHGNLNVHLSF